jgi:hypothetical protein
VYRGQQGGFPHGHAGLVWKTANIRQLTINVVFFM